MNFLGNVYFFCGEFEGVKIAGTGFTVCAGGRCDEACELPAVRTDCPNLNMFRAAEVGNLLEVQVQGLLRMQGRSTDWIRNIFSNRSWQLMIKMAKLESPVSRCIGISAAL